MKPIPRSVLLPLAAGCILISSSCAHQIRYPLDEEPSWARTHIEGTVKVETFRDEAPREEKINVSMGEEHWRVTGREGYRGGEIAPGVSAMLARHLAHSGLFDGVVGPESEAETDYVLSGAIHDFNATGRVRPKAENAVLMGTGVASLAGTAAALAATENVTTEVSSNVDLRDVKLREAETGKVVFERRRIASSSREENVHFLEADAPKLFRRADRELRNAVVKLIEDLGSSRLAKPVEAAPE